MAQCLPLQCLEGTRAAARQLL